MKVSQPKVKKISQGHTMEIKQMSAKAGELLPKHSANVESVLVVTQGKCNLMMNGENHALSAGESFIVPKELKHQISVEEDFKAYHIMPK